MSDERMVRVPMDAWSIGEANRAILIRDRECTVGLYIDKHLGPVDVIYRLRSHDPSLRSDLREEYLGVVDRYAKLAVMYSELSDKYTRLVESKNSERS